jgi:hypothetical protein
MRSVEIGLNHAERHRIAFAFGLVVRSLQRRSLGLAALFDGHPLLGSSKDRSTGFWTNVEGLRTGARL